MILKTVKWSKCTFLLNAFILLVLFIIFWGFNEYTPFVYDDIGYRYIHDADKSFFDIRNDCKQITSFSEALISTKALFFSWGGRLIFFATAHTLFMFDKFWFNLLNSAMAVSVIFMICKNVTGRNKVTPGLLLAVASLFFLCAPSPGLTLFWANGAIVYLWTSLFYLLLLYWVLNPPESQLTVPLLFFVGVIACNSNENVAIAILLLLCGYAGWLKREGRSVPGGVWSGLCGAGVGCLILFAAPGVMKRVLFEAHPPVNIFQNTAILLAHVLHTVPWLGVSAAVFCYWSFSYFDKEQKRFLLFYWLLALTCACAMIFSPYIPGRALFGCFIFLLCIWGKCFNVLPERVSKLKRTFVAGIVIIALVESMYAFRDVRFTYQICQKRMQYMKIAQSEGRSENWQFRPLVGLSPYNALFKTDILREDPEHFLNRHYCKMYGQKSVKLLAVPAIQGMSDRVFDGDGNE